MGEWGWECLVGGGDTSMFNQASINTGTCTNVHAATDACMCQTIVLQHCQICFDMSFSTYVLYTQNTYQAPMGKIRYNGRGWALNTYSSAIEI